MFIAGAIPELFQIVQLFFADCLLERFDQLTWRSGLAGRAVEAAVGFALDLAQGGPDAEDAGPDGRPGLADLPRLVARTTDAGLPVTLVLDPPDLRLPKLEDQNARSNQYLRRDSDWVTADITVSTVAEQIPIAPGYKQSDSVADGRRLRMYSRIAIAAMTRIPSTHQNVADVPLEAEPPGAAASDSRRRNGL